MSELTLYTTPLSANGRKPLAVALQLGLAPKLEEVNVYRGEGQRPEYLAINPSGKIPALVDGDLVLSESNAIVVYLCESHGGNRLWARDPARRARIARWLFWEAAHWQPALTDVLADHVGHRLLPDRVPAPAAPPAWDAASLRPLLAALEDRLAGSPWLAGPTPTLADFCVAGMTTYFRANGFPFDRYPRIGEWCARLDVLESWRSSASELWS